MKKLPDFSFEKQLWEKGYYVIGVDEVGRGSFAGPLMVAGVCFLPLNDKQKIKELESLGINDSKKLTPKTREKLSQQIYNLTSLYAHSTINVSVINKVGIGNATKIGVRNVIATLRTKTGQRKLYMLMDAFYIKYVKGVGLKNQKAIIHGDEISLSIAAASIIAKVKRDALMTALSKKYPHYFLDKNKGYGTADHIKALKLHGTTKIHRTEFVRNVFNVNP